MRPNLGLSCLSTSVLLGALLLGCLPPPASSPIQARSYPTRDQPRAVDCNRVNAGLDDCQGSIACRVACGGIAAEKEADVPQYDRAAGTMCPTWGAIRGKRTQIESIHLAWCDIYDLSPETCWCLTNEKALRKQADAYTAACESGEPGSADAVLERQIQACGAFPR